MSFVIEPPSGLLRGVPPGALLADVWMEYSPSAHEQMLREQPQRYVEMVQSISAYGICLLDRDGVIRSWNRGATLISGLREDIVCGMPYARLFADEALHDNQPQRALDFARANGHCREEQLRRRGSGDSITVSSTLDVLRDAEGQLTGFVEVVQDITEQKERERQLYERATRDALTGVANRGHFCEIAQQEIERARRFAEPLSLLLIDIDHFKRINDQYGHEVGDQALCMIARACRGSLRRIDTVGRIGGEEFAVLLPRADKQPALEIAQRLRRELSEQKIPAPPRRHNISLTVSGGLASLRPLTRDLGELLRHADAALYRAKRGGRNAVLAWFE